MVANKCDLATEEQIADFERFVREKGYDFEKMTAATAQGTQEIVNVIARELDKLPPIKIYEPEAAPETEVTSKREFTVTVDDDGVYVVEGDWMASTFGNVDPDDYESLQFFQRVLRSSGIIDRLEEMGIEKGDTVSIYDIEFDYEP